MVVLLIKQKQMSYRYEKIDPVMLYQQQKSHYEHLLNPRFTIKVDFAPRKTVSLYHHNKTAHEKDRHRKIENKKMLVTLLDIYNHKPGILSQPLEEERQITQQKRRSLYSSFKKEQMDKEIRKENRELFYSLLKIGPSIGNHKEWNKHYQQHLSLEKKLRSHLGKEYFDINQFRQSITRETKRRGTMLERRSEATQDLEEKRPVSFILKNKDRKKKRLNKKNEKYGEQIENSVEPETLLLG